MAIRATLANRLAERPLYGPAKIEAGRQNKATHPKKGGPFRHAQGSAIEGQQTILTGVSHLRRPSGPAAVARLVVPVVVDPVDAVACGRSRPHVREEVEETVCARPAVAYPDAPAAVVGVHGVGWPRAAIPHLRPCQILRRARQAMPSRTCRREPAIVTIDFNHDANLRNRSPIGQGWRGDGTPRQPDSILPRRQPVNEEVRHF